MDVAIETLGWSDAVRMNRTAPRLTPLNPGLSVDVLAQAWEQQAADRRRFMAYFSSDKVVLPGRKLKTQMSAVNDYRYAEATAAAKREE